MLLPFEPLWLIGNRHLQTMLGIFANLSSEPPSDTLLIDLPDGDRIALEVSTPPGWSRNDPTVVMLHGLTGSHRSAYMIRLANKFYDRGWRAIRFNARGCGTGEGLARNPYHGGLSDDVRLALERLKADTPNSEVTLAGFSLGGNIALKLAAELGASGPDLLREVITFCPSADLNACYRRISTSTSRAYERMFVMAMRWQIKARNELFPDDPHEVPDTKTLYEFDDLYTSRLWGFSGVDDYYTRASALPLMHQIRVPARITLAENDPIVDPAMFDEMRLPSCVSLRKVAGGGHLGFLARPGESGVQWMDRQLLRWTD